MQFEDAIDVVSELFRINQWSADDFGVRYAVVDDDIEIRAFQESNILILQGLFGEEIAGNSQMNANEARLKYLMQVNFIRIITHNDAISIDNQSNRLCLTRRIDIGRLSDEALMNEVENFVQNIDFWNVIIKRKAPEYTMSPLLGMFR